MSNVPKIYVGFFSIVLSVFILIGIVVANMNSAFASDFLNKSITEIECSNFSNAVIQECRDTASKNGFTMNIDTIKNDNEEIIMAQITVLYFYEIPLLNIKKEFQKTGYAR